MRKIILVNGLIAGVIVSTMMVISLVLQEKVILKMNNGVVIGYTSMLLALSSIFFGVKTYRDQYENGTIGFWSATKIGLAITLVAAVLYALTWEVYYSYKGEEFMEYYTQCRLDELKAEGKSPQEIEEARAEQVQMNEYYRSFFVRFPMTLLEILPVGLIISLISAGLLRRSQFLPA